MTPPIKGRAASLSIVVLTSLMAAADVALHDLNLARANAVFGGDNLFSLQDDTASNSAAAAGLRSIGFGRSGGRGGLSAGAGSSPSSGFGLSPQGADGDSPGGVQRAGFTASLSSPGGVFRNRIYLDRGGRLADALRRLDADGPVTGPTGDDNISIISEFEGEFLEIRQAPGVSVVQTGNRNFSLVIQRDTQPQTVIEQVGNDNISEVRQLAGSNAAFARVRQDGDTGVSQVAQSGPDGFVTVFQTQGSNALDSSVSQAGIRDEALVVQGGFQMASLIIQSGGEDNVAGLFQVGDRNISEITQLGSRNQAYVEQTTAGNRSSLTQTGTGHTAVITQ